MTTTEAGGSPSGVYFASLVVAALGVVFGDIGTSPLYALRECFTGEHGLAVTNGNVYGVISLIVWSLVIVISVKYLLYVMRADNRGEGGVLALMALAMPQASGNRDTWRRKTIVGLGLFGAALLYGDGIITPAISVMSAVEGLEIATPLFEPFIIPLAVCVLVALFLPQKSGTGRIGILFGPIIGVWFVVLIALGIRGILLHPSILLAVLPSYAVQLLMHESWHGFIILGAVFLVVTGGEALYADMGHFGRRPIRCAWFSLVLPALLINYFGQGALILETPESVANPFFLLAPTWGLYPLVGLATVAAVIASQALISGAFSMTRQAVQLGYLPRMAINHTSKEEMGQIYIPFVNWAMMLGTIFLVFFFQSSSAMAAAYGIAVVITMVITTLLTCHVAISRWRWNSFAAGALTLAFLVVDGAFFASNVLKIQNGGWFPLVVAAAGLILMTTWHRGRIILANRLREKSITMEAFRDNIEIERPVRVGGMAVFMTSAFGQTPPALLHNMKHNRVLHELVVMIQVVTESMPRVPKEQRYQLEDIGDGFYRMVIHYGFMDSPNIPLVLTRQELPWSQIRSAEITYFLGRETLFSTPRAGMAQWRERLFVFMSQNAQRATTFFRIPPNQVVEIGIQVEL